jgi:hypothetical protein
MLHSLKAVKVGSKPPTGELATMEGESSRASRLEPILDIWKRVKSMTAKPYPSQQEARILPTIAIASVAIALVARLIYRGPYAFGWEVLGSAHGQYLASTQGFLSALWDVVYSTRHYWYWVNINSVIYTLIPGYLGRLLPWEYWGGLVTFLISIGGLALVARAVGLSLRQSWVLILCWGAAPEYLSYSITGYPSFTAIFPHAMALWIVLDRKLHQRPIASLLLGLLSIEISWHLYESGRTNFAVFLAASILLKNVPWALRAIWISLGLLQLWSGMHFSSAAKDIFVSDFLKATLVHKIQAVGLVLRQLYTHPTVGLPTLLTLGVVCLATLKKLRWFVAAMLLFQLALYVVVAIRGPDELHSRRFGLVEIYSILAIALKFKELSEGKALQHRATRAIIAVLLLGNAWQMAVMMAHFRIPARENKHPLPYTFAPHDIISEAELTDWYLLLRERVAAGEKILLAYNFSVWSENVRDPNAVLERLYLWMGHDRFVESVVVFGSEKCRYDCMPILPLTDVPAFLASLQPGGARSGQKFVVHFHKVFQSPETEKVLAQIRETYGARDPQALGPNYLYFPLNP